MSVAKEWALQQLTPGAEWSVINGVIVWHDTSIPRPSDAEIDAKAAEYEAETACAACRDKRNALLSACDWTQIPDTSLTEAERGEWATYRQALRDVPQQAGFPNEVIWPTKP